MQIDAKEVGIDNIGCDIWHFSYNHSEIEKAKRLSKRKSLGYVKYNMNYNNYFTNGFVGFVLTIL